MIGYRKAKKLLQPGDLVYTLDDHDTIHPAKIAEICDGWLETDIGILDFDDHGITWWLTQRVAMENANNWR